MVFRSVFKRMFVLASALAGVFLAAPAAPAMADYANGWNNRAHVQNVRIYNRNTVVVRRDGRDHRRNDHNRDALTNAALLKQSILLSRMTSANDRCSGAISAHSNCTTRGGARVAGTGR